MNRRRISIAVFLSFMMMFVMISGCGGGSDDAPSLDYISANIGILKYVPGGAFQRDVTTTNISNVSAFRMSEKEITRQQFFDIMGTDPSNPAFSSGSMSDPVQQVNWYHAIAFCNKLSIAEGLTRVYDVAGFDTDQDWIDLDFGDIPTPIDSRDATWDAATANWSANGYRLPTEMEWMWAAMGATSALGYESPTYLTGYGKLFAGSNATNAAGDNGTNLIGDYVWYVDNSSSTSHPVGTTGTTGHANELGLYDMSGNVSEWCWDWGDDYPTGNVVDYRGPDTASVDWSEYRINRGGTWGSNPHPTEEVLTVSGRDSYGPERQISSLGIRVVRN